jgi:hypothetical protein
MLHESPTQLRGILLARMWLGFGLPMIFAHRFATNVWLRLCRQSVDFLQNCSFAKWERSQTSFRMVLIGGHRKSTLKIVLTGLVLAIMPPAVQVQTIINWDLSGVVSEERHSTQRNAARNKIFVEAF